MIYRLAPTPNASSCENYQQQSQINQINEALFWTAAAVCTLIALFGIIANGLVIYFAKHDLQMIYSRTLRHINTVVKHLAVSNLLYGLVGCPLLLAYWKEGKN